MQHAMLHTYTSHTHTLYRYGVSLVAIGVNETTDSIRLNPGPRHTMASSDICYYLNITKEENSLVFSNPSPSVNSTSTKLVSQDIAMVDVVLYLDYGLSSISINLCQLI